MIVIGIFAISQYMQYAILSNERIYCNILRCKDLYCVDPAVGKKNLNLITKELKMNDTIWLNTSLYEMPAVQMKSVACTCILPVIRGI